jgi:hypothetical protein
MLWEIARHRWSEFGDPRLGEWILELVTTQNSQRANELLSIIESEVVPPSGNLQPGASAAAACLVQGLISATSVARVEVLYLLFQLAGGAVRDVATSVSRLAVAREITLGLPIFAEIAETGTRTERLQCIDVLSMCARFDQHCFSRVRALLLEIADMGDDEASSVSMELDDLDESSFHIS